MGPKNDCYINGVKCITLTNGRKYIGNWGEITLHTYSRCYFTPFITGDRPIFHNIKSCKTITSIPHPQRVQAQVNKASWSKRRSGHLRGYSRGWSEEVYQEVSRRWAKYQ